MSKRPVVEIIDEPVDYLLTTAKDSNLKWIRVRLSQFGSPAGNMKLQILNNAKDTVLAESNNLLCSYMSETEYDASQEVFPNIDLIKFDFGGEAIRTGTNYYARLLPDSTYFAGRDNTNHIVVHIDYPKPTNDNGAPTIEATHGRNFTKYPLLTLQTFGRDFGE